MSNAALVAVSTAADESSGEEQYQELASERLALAPDELLQPNLDLELAIIRGLAAGPRVRAHRAELARQLPHFDMSPLDRLEAYTRALRVAYTRYRGATKRHPPLKPLVTRAKELRAVLLSSARALVARDLLEAASLRNVGRPAGAVSVSQHLGILVVILRDAWPRIENKVPISWADLDAAELLYEQLMHAKGLSQDEHPRIEAARDELRRAFTLFHRVYDQARRLVTFLRWEEGDLEQIVPSLYGGRRRRNRHKPKLESGQESPL